jgi:DNA-3-methyladenine glycosylase I
VSETPQLPGDATSGSAAEDALVHEGLHRHPDGLLRCWWCGEDPAYVAYHDTEWGRPVRDERQLFEKLCLEAFQAGLSWLTILRRREALRAAFAGFDPERVADFTDRDVARLLDDASIVRNRAKIEATIGNARAVCELRRRRVDLAALVWSFAPAPTGRPSRPAEVPARTPGSTALSTSLKAHGFRFVGPVTAYAFMQAMGLVDDHLEGCHVPPEATGPGS